jgi:hypothetical protein
VPHWKIQSIWQQRQTRSSQSFQHSHPLSCRALIVCHLPIHHESLNCQRWRSEFLWCFCFVMGWLIAPKVLRLTVRKFRATESAGHISYHLIYVWTCKSAPRCAGECATSWAWKSEESL